MNLKFWLSVAISCVPNISVYLKLLSNVKQRNTPLEECSSEDTHLKQARLDALRGAIWCVKKKPPVKATILSSAIKSASWTIEPRKLDLKILCRTRQGSTWNGQKTEVHFILSLFNFNYHKPDIILGNESWLTPDIGNNETTATSSGKIELQTVGAAESFKRWKKIL